MDKIVVTPEERMIIDQSFDPITHRRNFGANRTNAQFMVWLKQSSGQMMNTRHFRFETDEWIYEELKPNFIES